MANREWWTDWNLSYLDDVYGPLYGGHSVQIAVVNTLEKWMPTYISAINRNLGSEVLAVPFSYRFEPEVRTLPRDAVAAIMVTVPSTADAPERQQNSYRTNWRVEVRVFVFGSKDWQETEALTQAYAAATRALLIQQGGLGGFAETTMWDGEQYVEGEHSSTRTTGIAHIRFSVTIGSVMDPRGGPPLPQFTPLGGVVGPDTDPPADPPIATSTDVTVEKEPV